MIESLFASLAVLRPLYLVGLPLLAALLIYIYLRRGRAPVLVVSSILLLRKLKSVAASRKHFVPPFRFFLELLLLSLILLAATGLYYRGAGSRVAVLIDNSLSMAAPSGQRGAAASRLADARNEAAAWIHALPAGSEIEVYLSSPALHSISGGFVGQAQAVQVLEDVAPVFAADHLESALRNLAARGAYQSAVVLTDRSPVNAGSALSRESFFVIKSLAQIRSNLALSQFDIRNSFGAEQGRLEAQVGLVSHASEDLRTVLRLDAMDAGGTFVEMARREIDLKSGASLSETFANLKSSGDVWRVELSLKNPGIAADVDAITEDNTAYAVTHSRRARTLLVSDLSPEQLGLQRIHFNTFVHLRPEDYSPAKASGSDYDTAVFHRYVPELSPAINTLYILPERGNADFSRGDGIERTEVARVDQTHALSSYIKSSELKIGRSVTLKPNPWARGVVFAQSGPIAVAGESGSRRSVVYGFEILPYEGKESPAASIFFLNALKWLSPSVQTSGLTAEIPFDSGELEGQPEYLVSSSSRWKEGSAQLTGGAGKLTASSPGVVRLPAKSGQARLEAVNFYDVGESNTLKGIPFEVPSGAASASQLFTGRSLTSLFGLTAAFLLLLDLLYCLCRRAFHRGGK